MKLSKLTWPLVALAVFLGSCEPAGSETTDEAADFATSTVAASVDARCEAEGLSEHQRDTCLAVAAAFPDAPGMVDVARCESTLMQFEPDGVTPRWGRKSSDVGAFQINIVHWADAHKRGIDLGTLEGNIAYARLLYGWNGYGDWYMSRDCHGLS